MRELTNSWMNEFTDGDAKSNSNQEESTKEVVVVEQPHAWHAIPQPQDSGTTFIGKGSTTVETLEDSNSKWTSLMIDVSQVRELSEMTSDGNLKLECAYYEGLVKMKEIEKASDVSEDK